MCSYLRTLRFTLAWKCALKDVMLCYCCFPNIWFTRRVLNDVLNSVPVHLNIYFIAHWWVQIITRSYMWHAHWGIQSHRHRWFILKKSSLFSKKVEQLECSGSGPERNTCECHNAKPIGFKRLRAKLGLDGKKKKPAWNVRKKNPYRSSPKAWASMENLLVWNDVFSCFQTPAL